MKAVLLNSGGIDSLAVAMKFQDDEIYSLYVDLGQPNNEEASAIAEKVGNKFCKSHFKIKLDGVHPTELAPGFVGFPFQLALVYLLGAVYAKQIGAQYVMTGAKAETIGPEFKSAFADYLRVSKVTEAIIPLAPFELAVNGYQDIYPIVKDEPLLVETVSCNKLVKCGVCPRCKERQELGIDPKL